MSILALIFTGSTFSSWAQQNFFFDLITLEESANFGAVNSLGQDASGIIWMGVIGKGLAFYESQSIKRFVIKDEENFANSTPMFCMGNGVLYLNSVSGVNIFDPIDQKLIGQIEVPEKNRKGDTFDELLYNIVDSDTLIWALSLGDKYATRNYYKQYLPTEYTVYVSKNGAPFEFVSNTTFQSKGLPLFKLYEDKIVIKDLTGIVILDQHGRKEHQQIPDARLERMTSQNVYIDEDHGLWFGGSKTKTNLLPHSIQYWNLKEEEISEFFVNQEMNSDEISNEYPKSLSFINDQLHIDLKTTLSFDDMTMQPYELLTENAGDQRFIRDPLSTLLDRSGTLWMGGTPGLMKVNAPTPGLHLVPTIGMRSMVELPDGKVYGFFAGKPGSSIPEEMPGITVYDPKTNLRSTIPLTEFENDGCPIHSWMKADTKDSIIYISHCKIDVFNKRITKQSDIYHNDIGGSAINVMIDRKDRLWKSSWNSNRVGIYDLDHTLIRMDTMPGMSDKLTEVNDMYQRPSTGNVWIGTRGHGLFIVPEDGGAMMQMSRKPESSIKLSNSYVSAFYEDQKHNMWIGHGSGLSKISPDLNEIINFPIYPEFPEKRLVYAILPEDGETAFWLSTDQGIYRFDINSETFMDFPLNPIVMEAEYNRTAYLKTSNGTMIFGGDALDNRTVCFRPEEIIGAYKSSGRHQASVIIHQVRRYDSESKLVESKKHGLQNIYEIILEPGDRSFEMDFSVADFRSPEDNYYSYYLEGYEKTWNIPNRHNNNISYENVQPGKYKLKLAGALMKDDVLLNQREIIISVLPFWYQTLWAKLLFGVFLLGLIFLIYQFNLNRQFEKQEAVRLKDLDQLKTRLYTNITHEFRTPLTVIMGMNDNIQGHEQEKGLIKRNARNLLRLINQLLDLSKLDSGKLKVDQLKGDLIGYLQYLTESFYSMASDKKIDLSFKSDQENLSTYYDEVKVQHIVYNLLSNAIKYTRPGGKVAVDISTHMDGGSNMIRIKIRDTGVGISKNHLPHIFDRFYQIEDDGPQATKNRRIFGGTGVGLALTKEMVDLLKGSIHVKSEKGWGTEVTVSLPVRTIQSNGVKANPVTVFSNNDAKPEFESLPSKPDQISNGKPLILVVEDNSGVVSYIKSIISESYMVEVAMNGQEGLDRALDLIPDIILTDVMMPEKNGYELTEILKQDERTSHIPIVMLTAKADLSSKITGYELGADAYLSKPFEKKELLVRLQNLLGMRKKLQAYYSGKENELPLEATVRPVENLFLKKASAFVDEQVDNPELSISELANHLLMSQTQLYRKLKALTGQTPTQFIRAIRLKRALQLLKSSDLNISEIAYEVGFNDPNYFTRIFKKEYGRVPGEVR